MMNRGEFWFRLFDVFFCILFLILLSPLIILVAFLIKVCDLKSPVLVKKHHRVGKDGKLFLMYKFRTMVPNAHDLILKDPKFKKLRKKQIDEGKLKMKDDIRVTKIGRIIRKIDFDEIPQLFNVLKGEMSIVGPRAYFEEEIDDYSQKYDIFNKRIGEVLRIKPGVTGLWQVSGRNLLSPEKRVQYDYEYLKNRSLLLNTLILLKTPYVVLTRYGAYD